MRSTPLKRRMSVSGKFILLSSSLIIIFSVIIALFFIRNEIRYSYQKLLNHGRTVAAMVSQSSEFGIYTEDQESLRQITKSLDIDPDIVYVAILDKDFRYLTKKSINRHSKSLDIVSTVSNSGTISLSKNSGTQKRKIVILIS